MVPIKHTLGTLVGSSSNAIQALEQIGAWIADSKLCGVTSREQGVVMALACLMEDKNPLEIARTYHVIEGRLCKRADAMLADYLSRGGRVRWDETTAEVCSATFTHPEYAPEGVCFRVTLQELKDSGVAVTKYGLKDNYRKFPRQMLRARVISEAIRAIDPAVNSGVYTPEEVQDFEPSPVTSTIQEPPKTALIAPGSQARAIAPPPPKHAQKQPILRVVEPQPQPQLELAEPDSEDPAPPIVGLAGTVQKLIASWVPWGVIQSDLEALAHRPSNEWDNVDIDKFRSLYRECSRMSEDDRRQYITAVFNLEPGSLG